MHDEHITNDCLKPDKKYNFIYMCLAFTLSMQTFDLSDGAITTRPSNFMPPPALDKTLTKIVGMAIRSTGSFPRV